MSKIKEYPIVQLHKIAVRTFCCFIKYDKSLTNVKKLLTILTIGSIITNIRFGGAGYAK